MFAPIVVLADGSLKRVGALPRGMSRADALNEAIELHKVALEEGIRRRKRAAESAATGDMKAWVKEWHQARVKRGLTYAGESLQHYHNHIAPALGGKHVAEWTEDDLRDFVLVLDTNVAEKKLRPKTAKNIWGTATKMVADAVRSKVPALRCRKDNPTANVEGPDSGEKTAKVFLYPSEALRFLACDEVPLNWRRMTALAIYTFLRTGELRALRWEDIDLEHGVIHVHRFHRAADPCHEGDQVAVRSAHPDRARAPAVASRDARGERRRTRDPHPH